VVQFLCLIRTNTKNIVYYENSKIYNTEDLYNGVLLFNIETYGEQLLSAVRHNGQQWQNKIF